MKSTETTCQKAVPGGTARCTRPAGHRGDCAGPPCAKRCECRCTDPACATGCAHEFRVPCTRPTGHTGVHEHRRMGHFPGAPGDGVVTCTWRGR